MAAHPVQAAPGRSQPIRSRPRPGRAYAIPWTRAVTFTILAQANLQEHQTRDLNESQSDQHECQCLSGSITDHGSAQDAGTDQHPGRPKRDDPSSAAHGLGRLGTVWSFTPIRDCCTAAACPKAARTKGSGAQGPARLFVPQPVRE